MSTYYEIPLESKPHSFQAQLGGTTYTLTVRFNPVLGVWVLDIGDAQSLPIVGGIALVPGVDLLGQYRHLGVPKGQLVMGWVTLGAVQPPGFDNLGTDGRLYFIPD